MGLEQLGVGNEQLDAKVQRPTSKPILRQTEQQHQQPEDRLQLELGGMNQPQSIPAGDSMAIEKSKAFRAAAQDDVRTFNEIIDSVPVDIWSKWENQAGRTLLTLSQQRRSDVVHAQIAKALALPGSSSSSKTWEKWSRIMQYN